MAASTQLRRVQLGKGVRVMPADRAQPDGSGMAMRNSGSLHGYKNGGKVTGNGVVPNHKATGVNGHKHLPHNFDSRGKSKPPEGSPAEEASESPAFEAQEDAKKLRNGGPSGGIVLSE